MTWDPSFPCYRWEKKCSWEKFLTLYQKGFTGGCHTLHARHWLTGCAESAPPEHSFLPQNTASLDALFTGPSSSSYVLCQILDRQKHKPFLDIKTTWLIPNSNLLLTNLFPPVAWSGLESHMLSDPPRRNVWCLEYKNTRNNSVSRTLMLFDPSEVACLPPMEVLESVQ